MACRSVKNSVVAHRSLNAMPFDLVRTLDFLQRADLRFVFFGDLESAQVLFDGPVTLIVCRVSAMSVYVLGLVPYSG